MFLKNPVLGDPLGRVQRVLPHPRGSNYILPMVYRAWTLGGHLAKSKSAFSGEVRLLVVKVITLANILTNTKLGGSQITSNLETGIAVSLSVARWNLAHRPDPRTSENLRRGASSADAVWQHPDYHGAKLSDVRAFHFAWLFYVLIFSTGQSV